MVDYKYAEGQIIEDFKKYVDSTYSEHYLAAENIQCLDAWIALGDSATSFRDTAIKYLWRFGKKAGNNKKDLLKAMHYVLLMMYVEFYKDQQTESVIGSNDPIDFGDLVDRIHVPYDPNLFGPVVPYPAVPGIAAPYVANNVSIGVPFGFPYNTAAAEPYTYTNTSPVAVMRDIEVGAMPVDVARSYLESLKPKFTQTVHHQHSDGFGVA
jgi:hypothetical protein